MGEFQNDLAFAKIHEERFHKLVQLHRETTRVHDVSDDVTWQKRGADLIWERISGAKVPIEVKTSRNFRGVLYLETLANTRERKPGWFQTSEATYIAAGFADREVWYVYAIDEMREFVRGRRLRRIFPATTKQGEVAYRSECHVLPLDTEGLFPRIIRTCIAAFHTPGEGLSKRRFYFRPRKVEWGSGRVVAADSERFVAQFELREEPVTLSIQTISAGYILCAEKNVPLSIDLVVGAWSRPSTRQRH